MVNRTLQDLIPSEFWDMNGSVFYSGPKAFEGNKSIYVLGLNPGGILEDHKGQTLLHHTDKIKVDKWSEFKDVCWEGRPAGTSPYQRRVLHLIQSLGFDPQLIPASNVVFLRTRSQKELKNTFQSLAETCWPFHNEVINRNQIQNIVCFGKLGGHFVRKKLGANEKMDEFREKNKRRWKTSVYKTFDNKKVIITPHPSRADFTNPTADPAPFLKNYLQLS